VRGGGDDLSSLQQIGVAVAEVVQHDECFVIGLADPLEVRDNRGVRAAAWMVGAPKAPGDPSLGPALRQEDVPVLRAVRPGECHARLVEIGESNAIERLQVPDATPLFSQQLSREGCGPDEVMLCATSSAKFWAKLSANMEASLRA
jgi:hypothetical protein